MTVYDRWHLTHPPADATPCRCSRGKNKLYPGADHGQGDRWQVRYRDEAGKQRKRNFAKKDGKDPERCADAFDAQITDQLNKDNYTDPDAGKRPFKDYAEEIVANRAVGETTRYQMRTQLARHVYPMIGETELRKISKRPSTIQALIARMERAGLGAGTIKVVMAYVSMVLNCALDDGLIARNPCKAPSVVLPAADKTELVVWTAEMVSALREALPERYAAMVDCGAGLGMRQGEVFAFGPDDVEWLSLEPVVRVDRQIKVIGGKLVYDLPKGRKARTVELSPDRQVALAEHMRRFPPAAVTLPWRTRDGEPVTKRLFFTDGSGRPLHRAEFNPGVWHVALKKAGIPATRENMQHALRHYFASVLLTEGENVKAVSLWLGHHSPDITLKIYTHVMPKSGARMRKVIDKAMEPAAEDARPTSHGEGS